MQGDISKLERVVDCHADKYYYLKCVGVALGGAMGRIMGMILFTKPV